MNLNQAYKASRSSLVSRSFCQDNRLSFQARGLGSFLASMPDPIRFTATDVSMRWTGSETDEEIASAIEELAQFGWITKEG